MVMGSYGEKVMTVDSSLPITIAQSYLLQWGLGGVLLRVKSGMVGCKRQNWEEERRQTRVFNYKRRRRMRVALLMSSTGRWKKNKNFFPLHFCLFQLGDMKI